ncbi:MAG TPA: DNA repair protein RadC, partial [Bacteroidales bacterium]|nr:DNA repair protein RadC [Bacteroidales bacterium]
MPIAEWAEADRPREKLMERGRTALSDAELIAILIGSGTPRESAVQLGRRILGKAGNNLVKLGQMDLHELMAIQGIGPARAVSILAALELGNRRLSCPAEERPRITSSGEAFDALRSVLADTPYEVFYILLLNRANRLIAKVMISEGGFSGTVADPKKIFKIAIERKASSIILAHNHPSGNLKPSDADVRLTRRLKASGEMLDLPVLDHII